jgi:Fe(3+) dicitrate transport protein
MSRIIIILTAALLLISSMGFSQQRISGRIIDAEDQQPLIGAIVQLEASGAGTVTNEQGVFQIISDQENDIAIIKYLGYNEMRIEITPTTTELEDIELVRANTTLDEVIVSASPIILRQNLREVIIQSARLP